MESLEISARTVEEATQQALDQLGVNRNQVEVNIVKEGKSGILGLGSDEAVVRVTLISEASNESSETPEVARETLDKLISLMGVSGTIKLHDEPLFAQDKVETDEETPSSIVLDINGEDLGILIGRRGQTLSCLQYITRLIVGNKTRAWLPITIDVEGYKRRRYEALQSFAQQMAEQVQANEKSFTMEPMPAYERRIVHLSLAEHPGVVTESIGQDESRRVVIMPKEYSE